MANISSAYGKMYIIYKETPEDIVINLMEEINEVTDRWGYNISLSKDDETKEIKEDNNFYLSSVHDMEDIYHISYTMSGSGRWSFSSNLSWLFDYCEGEEGNNSPYVIDDQIKKIYLKYKDKINERIIIRVEFSDIEPGCQVFYNGAYSFYLNFQNDSFSIESDNMEKIEHDFTFYDLATYADEDLLSVVMNYSSLAIYLDDNIEHKEFKEKYDTTIEYVALLGIIIAHQERVSYETAVSEEYDIINKIKMLLDKITTGKENKLELINTYIDNNLDKDICVLDY